MSHASPRSHPRAFVIAELVIVLLILLVAVLLVSLVIPDARRRVRLAGSIQNLQQIGKAATGFAADKNNRAFSFDWAPGSHECDGYQFPVATTYMEAAADQAVCILRERANRTDILAIRGWFPHVFYNHLVLIDYVPGSFLGGVFTSPGDTPRLAWQRAVMENPQDPNTAYFTLACRPAGNTQGDRRWPYSSSYELQASFYSPDAVQFRQGDTPIPTVQQDPLGHRYYQPGNSATVLGQRRMDEIHYPSHKVMLYETNQRFYGSRNLYFMYQDARVPLLFADGSAAVRSSSRANPGFQPNSPTSGLPTRVNYSPELTWETPTANGGGAEYVNGVFRWTRSGLRGRDFGGPEIPWVQ
jgi:hypothetical protein